MNTVETILVVLLAIGFIVLLTLSIILVSLLVAVVKNVKRASDRAEEMTASFADIVKLIGTKIAPVAISAALAAAFRRAGKSRKNKKED